MEETASEMIARAKAYTEKLLNSTSQELETDPLFKLEKYVQSTPVKPKVVREYINPRERFIERNLLKFGFWEYLGEARASEVQSKIVPEWNKTKLAQDCVEYLLAGTNVEQYMGFAVCALCGKHLGTKDMCHERWLFPECWEHYIIEHSVRPWDMEFITDVTKWVDNGKISNNSLLAQIQSFKDGL